MKKEIIEKESRREGILDFINQLQERELLTGFDEQVWRGLVDFLTVYENGSIDIQFYDGKVIRL
mgnify:FL=1